MLVKKIKYTDYKGTEREDELRFNLTESEVFKWLHGTVGEYTLDEALDAMTKKGNGKEIIKTVEDLILLSYGEISLDGRRFIKTEEMAEEFKQTEAYSILFMELATSAEKTADFIKGVIPASMSTEYNRLVEENKAGAGTVVTMPTNA